MYTLLFFITVFFFFYILYFIALLFVAFRIPCSMFALEHS